VWPANDPVDAFEQLLQAGAGGWVSVMDDGWAIDAIWSRTDAGTGLFPFDRATFSLRPWHSLKRRRVRIPA
jgi:hypothetical protein